jgi:hypothetical protein
MYWKLGPPWQHWGGGIFKKRALVEGGYVIGGMLSFIGGDKCWSLESVLMRMSCYRNSKPDPLPICHSLGVECPSKALVLKAQSPGGYDWKVVEHFGGGA